MKTYFFGDIHGNAFALEAVIQHYRQIRPDGIYCLEAWRSFPKKLIVSGHDHIPAVYELLETKGMPKLKDVRIHKPDAGKSLTISLNPGSHYWIKAGSVGGPYRDGVFAANSVLLDSGEHTLTLFSIPYPLGPLRQELANNRYCRNLKTLFPYLDLERSRSC